MPNRTKSKTVTVLSSTPPQEPEWQGITHTDMESFTQALEDWEFIIKLLTDDWEKNRTDWHSFIFFLHISFMYLSNDFFKILIYKQAFTLLFKICLKHHLGRSCPWTSSDTPNCVVVSHRRKQIDSINIITTMPEVLKMDCGCLITLWKSF